MRGGEILADAEDGNGETGQYIIIIFRPMGIYYAVRIPVTNN